MSTGRRKVVETKIWSDADWSVLPGEVKKSKPGKNAGQEKGPLFRLVAEKLPWGALTAVEADLKKKNLNANGVYAAHDSMGVPRYIGRGAVFSRLRSHKKRHPRELFYFSLFLIDTKAHEQDFESALIRMCSELLVHLNDKKVRLARDVGSPTDFRPQTKFYERQVKKGKKPKAARRRRA
jgi:hypothetical protein